MAARFNDSLAGSSNHGRAGSAHQFFTRQNDLSTAIGVAVDNAALNGTGTAPQPLGILHYPANASGSYAYASRRLDRNPTIRRENLTWILNGHPNAVPLFH